MATENIPSRLHSVAQGNVVTGANEILDDDKGKKQSVINQENDQRLETLEAAVGTGGSVDSRIESAKTEIVGGASSDCNTLGKAEALISTNANDIAALQEAYAALTQNDVVVVAPADTWPVATPAQNIIYRVVDRTNTPPQYYTDYMWNGTAMVEMAQYNNAIDPRPKKASQNLVTSGGVFDNMGALDVSELNATENPHTLAKYVDLSAALAAVPTDYQKGGMSIKFVQSSDNKYVEYFLTKNTWSASKADWEKVNLEEEVSQLGQETINIINLSQNHQKYADMATARMSVPSNKRKYGTVLVYILQDDSVIIEQATDNYWQAESIWRDLYNQNVLTVNYNTNAETTRIAIKGIYRKRGLIISYYNGVELICEQYCGTSISDSSFKLDANWDRINKSSNSYNDTIIDVDKYAPLPAGQYYTLSTAMAALNYDYTKKVLLFKDAANDYATSVYIKDINHSDSIYVYRPLITDADSDEYCVRDIMNITETGQDVLVYIKSGGIYQINYEEFTAGLEQLSVLMYHNGTLIESRTVTDGDILKLDSGIYNIRLRFDVTTTGTIKVVLRKLSEKHISEYKSFALLNRHKNLIPVNPNGEFKNRPQALMTTFKSFVPNIDYKGKIVTEGFSSLSEFDLTKPINFEEHTVFYSTNFADVIESYITKDGINFSKYQGSTVKPTDYGNPLYYGGQEVWHVGIGHNDNGLILSTVYSYQKATYLLWSLDGGRTFEPSIIDYRGSFLVNASELPLTAVVSIDGDSCKVTSITDAQNYITTNIRQLHSSDRMQASRGYLSTVILSSNRSQDTLRDFAGKLIEHGYKVMLNEESYTLRVFSKNVGAAGNGTSNIVINGVTKVFAGGVDYTQQQIEEKTNLLTHISDLVYVDGTHLSNDAMCQITSIVFADNKWKFFGLAYDGTLEGTTIIVTKQVANCLSYNDITDLQNSQYTYQNLLGELNDISLYSYGEPIAMYSPVKNTIAVVFRTDSIDKCAVGKEIVFVYSTDNGAYWSKPQGLPIKNISFIQGNGCIFLGRNPNSNYYLGTENFYNWPGDFSDNIWVALYYNRRNCTVYAATMDAKFSLDSGMWSDWVPLDRDNVDGLLNNYGIGYNQHFFTSDVSGNTGCIGSFSYSQMRKGVNILYVTSKVIDGDNHYYGEPHKTWCPMLSFEEC